MSWVVVQEGIIFVVTVVVGVGVVSGVMHLREKLLYFI